VLPGVRCRRFAAAKIRAYGVVVGLFSNSECTQQDGGDEQEYGAHRQDIEPQGKVHVRASLMVD